MANQDGQIILWKRDMRFECSCYHMWTFLDLNLADQLYIVDQPSRGRSPWQQGIDGPQSHFTTLTIEQRFTATRHFNLWPQAVLHTQWPGNGSQGDETFDNFYASILPFLSSNEEASQKVQRAGVALLDKIGVRGLQFFSQESPR